MLLPFRLDQDAAVLITLIGVVFLAGYCLDRSLAADRRKRRAPFRVWTNRSLTNEPPLTNYRSLTRHRPPTNRNKPSVGEQLVAVLDAQFTARRLLNQSEARVFFQVVRIVRAMNPEWFVMAQVSLGEILRSENPAAFAAVNCKRVDILLLDGALRPMHAIEYQGEGHHQSDAAGRDAIKKEALRRAGVGYHEVVAGQTTPVELQTLLTKLVPTHPAATTEA